MNKYFFFKAFIAIVSLLILGMTSGERFHNPEKRHENNLSGRTSLAAQPDQFFRDGMITIKLKPGRGDFSRQSGMKRSSLP